MNGINALSADDHEGHRETNSTLAAVGAGLLTSLTDVYQCSRLTARENEVLRCFFYGLLYKETADRLKISYSAVHKHQHNAFRKLGATNRSQAIRKWLDMGCK